MQTKPNVKFNIQQEIHLRRIYTLLSVYHIYVYKRHEIDFVCVYSTFVQLTRKLKLLNQRLICRVDLNIKFSCILHNGCVGERSEAEEN